MHRLVKQSAVVLLVALGAVALAPAFSSGQGSQSPLLPPHAKFRGTSYDVRNAQWVSWNVAKGRGGQDLPDTVDKVRYLPGAFVPGTYTGEFTVEPGTALVFPSLWFNGEVYPDGSFDDPAEFGPIIRQVYETSYIEASFDGQIVLRGLGSDLPAYQFGIIEFDEPIGYEEPSDSGGVAAIWCGGLGSIYGPPSVGTHTLHLVDDTLFFGRFEYTYQITVKPPGRK
jgi:hypothetical protein